MKFIKHIGLTIFLFSFGLFVASFFLHDYQLDRETFETVVYGSASTSDGEKSIAFEQANPGFFGKTYTSKFTFVSDLGTAIEETNKHIEETFSISDVAISQLGALSQENSFQVDHLNKIDPPLSDFQVDALVNYSSWMVDRTYDSQSAFESDFAHVLNGYNHQITQDKGLKAGADLIAQFTKEASTGIVKDYKLLFFILIYVLGSIGALLYILPAIRKIPGIKNNNIKTDSMNNRGWMGIALGSFLILFYVALYWFPAYIVEWYMVLDPLSNFMTNGDASRWFMYGFIYTIAIIVMGIRFSIKYRHNKYQLIRTVSVAFFQTSFAFILSNVLIALNKPYFDFKELWPLDYDLLTGDSISYLIGSGAIGYFMLFWGIIGFLVLVPVLSYFFGKRWYCSWVCGCGGLAETAGDSFRQLSDKSLSAWKVERIMIHAVLVFVVIMTAASLYTYFSGSSTVFGISTGTIKTVYGFAIGAAFAGVIGVGFYPLMGSRVWCRFGCPLAAYLGLVQRFKSKFRITTNGGQCISCGNCSTYCEMGIDVKWYAQRGQDIVRSSCVGCGICSAVCPRGVLKLENGPENSRKLIAPLEMTGSGIKVLQVDE